MQCARSTCNNSNDNDRYMGSGVSRTFLLGWPRWDTKLVWGGHGIAKFNTYTYAANCGSNPGPLLHVTSPLSPMISCLITVK